jgi:hypothetical protein
MEAVRTSETSVDNYFTRQYNPEDSSEHHTRRRENLKSHVYSLAQQNFYYMQHLKQSDYHSCFVLRNSGSNIGPETGYPNLVFSWFSSVPTGK